MYILKIIKITREKIYKAVNGLQMICYDPRACAGKAVALFNAGGGVFENCSVLGEACCPISRPESGGAAGGASLREGHSPP